MTKELSKQSIRINELMAQGLTPSQARYQYQKESGKVVLQKESKPLYKQDLINAGITEVTEDGAIFINGKQVKSYNKNGYYSITLNNSCLYVHRAVYVWFYNCIPSGYVVDHIDENKLNNNINNLQLLTIGNNVQKSRRNNSYKNLGKNQFTKNLSEEEWETHKAAKAAKKEKIAQKKALAKERQALLKIRSEDNRERARKIKELTETIDIKRAAYKANGTEENKRAWRQAVSDKHEYLANNPFVSSKCIRTK